MKNLDILNLNRARWYPLHEAVEIGHVDLVKVIVDFASNHDIDVLHKWDQNMISRPKYGIEGIRLFKFDSLEPQTSFLRLAVRTELLDMVNYFRKLYQDNCENNQGIFHAMIESHSRPEIFKVLIEAFPHYLHLWFGELQKWSLPLYVFTRGPIDSFVFLLHFLFKSNWKMASSEQHALKNTCESYLRAACENGDKRVLPALVQCCSNFSSNVSNPAVVYFMSCALKHAIEHGTIEEVKYLVDNGFDVYAFHEASLADVYDFTSSYWGNEILTYEKIYDHIRGPFKVSAMFWAAVSDKHDIMKYLVTIVKKEKLLELQLTSAILPSWMFFLPASFDFIS